MHTQTTTKGSGRQRGSSKRLASVGYEKDWKAAVLKSCEVRQASQGSAKEMEYLFQELTRPSCVGLGGNGQVR